MAFGKLKNRHDSWQQFCEQHQAILSDAELPQAISRSEVRFRELLRDGVVPLRDTEVSLAGLSAEQWSGLNHFVMLFLREFESYAPPGLFPAFHRESERRSSN